MLRVLTVPELEQTLEARTTENRHLRAEVCRLKREDWHVRWVFEHAAHERILAAAQLALTAAESANAAAELAGDRADRAEGELRALKGELASLLRDWRTRVGHERDAAGDCAIVGNVEGAAQARRRADQEQALADELERSIARAEAVLQVSRIFDVPVSMLAGPVDADPVSGDGFVEVTGRALYVDEGAV